MAITFQCSGCDGRLRAPDEYTGRRVKCGSCGALTPVPAAAPPEPPASEPAPAPEPPLADEIPAEPPRRPRAIPLRPRRPLPPRRSLAKPLAVVGLLALVLVAAGGALVWWGVTRPPEWRPHHSDRGGYAVDLPAAPLPDIERRTGFRQPDGGPRGAHIEGTVRRRTEYVVVWADYPGGHPPYPSDEQIIDAAFAELRKEFPRGTVTVGPPLGVDNFSARDGVVTVPGEGEFVFRVVVTDVRLYIVAAGGPFGSGSDPDVRWFLDSFRVTDPAIIARRLRNIDEHRRSAELRQAREEAERKHAAWFAEENRKRQEERQRQEAAEAERRAEAARQEAARLEAESKEIARIRDALEDEAAKFRARTPGLTAPDPTKLPGLKLYLSFDDTKDRVVPLWPRGEIATPTRFATGPGPRGRALYFDQKFTALKAPPGVLPEGPLAGPGTVCGWMKVQRGFTCDLLHTTSDSNRISALARIGLRRRDGRGPAIYTYVPVPDRYEGDRPSGEPFANSLSAAIDNEQEWHHIALSRGGPDARDRTRLYVDGELQVTFALPAAEPLLKDLYFGVVERYGWEQNRDHVRMYPHLPTAAIDELCLFDRELAPAEVKFLAHKGPEPVAGGGDVPKVKLTAAHTLDPLNDVAFDLDRKTVWVVSAVGGYWHKNEFDAARKAKGGSHLLRYSYPDFKLVGTWALPEASTRAGFYDGIGNRLALDRKNNRLFVLLGADGAGAHLQQYNAGYGTFYRFDLDDLPKWDPPGKPPVLTEAARQKVDRGSGWKIGGAAVSPDGEWLYYYDLTARNPPAGTTTAVVRAPADLSRTEEVPVVGSASWVPDVWPSADGKTVQVIQTGRDARGDRQADSGILEIDAATWKRGAVREVRGVDWRRSWREPIAVHPDGRTFAGVRLRITETLSDKGGLAARVRPVTASANAFLGVSADGRFLFVADAETGKNRLQVLDARKDATELGELATLDERPDRRVGGPFFVSPDGRFVVFRSGLVVRVDTTK